MACLLSHTTIVVESIWQANIHKTAFCSRHHNVHHIVVCRLYEKLLAFLTPCKQRFLKTATQTVCQAAYLFLSTVVSVNGAIHLATWPA